MVKREGAPSGAGLVCGGLEVSTPGRCLEGEDGTSEEEAVFTESSVLLCGGVAVCFESKE